MTRLAHYFQILIQFRLRQHHWHKCMLRDSKLEKKSVALYLSCSTICTWPCICTGSSKSATSRTGRYVPSGRVARDGTSAYCTSSLPQLRLQLAGG